MKVFEQLAGDLVKIKAQNAQALEVAVTQTAEFAHNKLVDAIYDRYNFRFRDYIAERITLKIDTKELEFRVASRMRKSSSVNFMEGPVYRKSKNKRTPNKQVIGGYTGSYLRGKTNHWRGAFLFTGLNGNLLMGYRNQGVKGREIPEVSYGVSVGGALGVVKDKQVDPVMTHLLNMYQKAL